MLKSTQRRMLRWMLGSFWKRPEQESDSDSDSSIAEPPEEEVIDADTDKQEEETWVDWIKRCTHTAEAHLRRASLEDWVVGQRRRKWRLAGHTARRDDHRWSETLLEWEPPYSNRQRGHPCKRWSTDLDAFFCHVEGVPQGVWKDMAQNRERWQKLEDRFISKSWYK